MHLSFLLLPTVFLVCYIQFINVSLLLLGKVILNTAIDKLLLNYYHDHHLST